jgi:hypothetical protein
MEKPNKSQNFFQRMWDPQGSRAERICIMFYWVGLTLWLANTVMSFGHLGAGTKADRLLEHSIISFVALICYIPMIVEAIISMRRSEKQWKRELQRLELELIVHETILKIFDPEGYARAKKEIEQRQAVSRIFNGKTGPKE